MKLNSTMLALSLGLCALGAGAQTVDMGPDAKSYRRFLLYPHLEKGFAAMARGERERALSEFEQASALAPDNPAVARHLAEAYRRFGEPARAQAVLREQLRRHPDHPGLNKALNDLHAQTSVSLPPPVKPVTSGEQQAARRPTALRETRQGPAATPPSASAPRRASAARSARLARMAERSHRSAPVAALPKAESAYEFADQAYQASIRGNHAAAVRAARQAVRLAPHNRAYRLLLVYELAVTDQLEEADAVAAQAPPDPAAASPDDGLVARHKLVRQRIAFKHFEASNQAAAAGQSEAAIESARQGIRYAPDLLAHRLQLVGLLLAERQWPQAERSATEAMAILGTQPALRVLRAHALQHSGQQAAASADLDAALAEPALTASEQRQFRLIAIDAALAAGEAQKALELLAPLEAASASDEGVLRRRLLALQASRRVVSAGAGASAGAWATPRVACRGNGDLAFCEIWPGAEQPEPGYAMADAAYKAFGTRNHGQAALKAREALELSPDNRAYRALLVNALLAGDQLAQADEAASGFLATSADDGEMLALRSSVRQRMGQESLAALDAQAALNSGNLSVASEIAMLRQLGREQQARERFSAAQREGALAGQSDVDVAYLAIQVGDDAAAMDAFERATSARTLPDPALRDAAYAAGRLGRSQASVDYFKRAIDASESGQTPLAPQSLFNARRAVADRTRKSGVYGSLTYRGIASSGLSLTPGSTDDTLQGGLEAYWRPFGYGDGRLVELYGGLAGTLYSKADLTTGAPSVQAALGARVKPLADANLVLALERRLGIGSQAQSDWLARLGYSWDKGLDLRVDTPAWWAAQVYAEAGRFIKLKQSYATFEGQAGRSFRLDQVHPRLVVFPHLVLGADRNTGYMPGQKNAVGAGVGASLRYWFNEDKYSAPRSYWDASLQYRGRISGDDRAKGVFLRLTLSY